MTDHTPGLLWERAAQHVDRAGVRQLHPERSCKLGVRVAQERDHGAIDSLVLAPGIHHRSVVDAVHEHLVDTGCLESVLLLKVTRYLHF